MAFPDTKQVLPDLGKGEHRYTWMLHPSTYPLRHLGVANPHQTGGAKDHRNRSPHMKHGNCNRMLIIRLC